MQASHSWAPSVQTELRTHWNYGQSNSGIFLPDGEVSKWTAVLISARAGRLQVTMIHLCTSVLLRDELLHNSHYFLRGCGIVLKKSGIQGCSLWKCSAKISCKSQQKQWFWSVGFWEVEVLAVPNKLKAIWLCISRFTLYFHAMLLLPVLGKGQTCLAQSHSGAVSLLSNWSHFQTWILK